MARTNLAPLAALSLALGLAICTACSITGGDAPDSNSAVRQAFGPQPSNGTSGTGTSGSSGAAGTPGARIANPATASAMLQEPGPDALRYGTAPAYADIQTAAIHGHSRTVSFTLSLLSALPERMPDAETTMRAGFRVQVGSDPYVLSANGSTEGWNASATKGGKGVRFDGTLAMKANTLTIVIPWSFLGGPRAFAWTGYAAWNQS